MWCFWSSKRTVNKVEKENVCASFVEGSICANKSGVQKLREFYASKTEKPISSINSINEEELIDRLKQLQASEAGVKDHPEGYLITYNLDELLNDGSLFNIQSERIKTDTLSKSKTTFRCICETEAW